MCKWDKSSAPNRYVQLIRTIEARNTIEFACCTLLAAKHHRKDLSHSIFSVFIDEKWPRECYVNETHTSTSKQPSISIIIDSNTVSMRLCCCNHIEYAYTWHRHTNIPHSTLQLFYRVRCLLLLSHCFHYSHNVIKTSFGHSNTFTWR